MRFTYILLFLFFGLTLHAQEAEEAPAKAAPDPVQQASAALEVAQSQFRDAQTALNQAQQAEVTAQNNLEKARVSLRQAKIGLSDAKKKTSPVEVNRYEVVINPIYEKMSKGTMPGLATYIEDVESGGMITMFANNVDNEFKAYMKQFQSSKVKKQKGELLFDNIHIPQMSAHTLDLYVDFIDHDNGVTIRTYFNNGVEFLDFNNEDPATEYARSMMDRFARYMRSTNLEDELKNLEKELEKNQKELENEKDDIAKARSEMQESRNEISDKFNKVATYEDNIDSLNDKIELTRSKLSKVN